MAATAWAVEAGLDLRNRGSRGGRIGVGQDVDDRAGLAAQPTRHRRDDGHSAGGETGRLRDIAVERFRAEVEALRLDLPREPDLAPVGVDHAEGLAVRTDQLDVPLGGGEPGPGDQVVCPRLRRTADPVGDLAEQRAGQCRGRAADLLQLGCQILDPANPLLDGVGEHGAHLVPVRRSGGEIGQTPRHRRQRQPLPLLGLRHPARSGDDDEAPAVYGPASGDQDLHRSVAGVAPSPVQRQGDRTGEDRARAGEAERDATLLPSGHRSRPEDDLSRDRRLPGTFGPAPTGDRRVGDTEGTKLRTRRHPVGEL